MSEPYWLEGDDVARGLADECENCGNLKDECRCGEPDPDRMHDEIGEW